MITHVVFDWNGTLLADAQIRYKLNMVGIRRLGHPGLSFAEYQEHLTIPVHDYYRKIGISEETIEKHSKEATVDFHDAYEKHVLTCRTRRGTRDVIKAVHNHHGTAIILSNHTADGIHSQLKRLKLDHAFDVVLANDDIHTSSKKGKIDRLVEYIKQYNLNPKNMVIVGDTEEETHIAKSLGMHSVAITGGTHSRKRLARVKPDAIVNSLYGLIDVLEEL